MKNLIIKSTKKVVLFGFLPVLLGLVFAPSFSSGALSAEEDSITSTISAFRFHKDVDDISVNVPTVVEVPFEEEFIERLNFAVLDNTNKEFEPYYFRQSTFVNEIPTVITSNRNTANISLINDGNLNTYVDFPLRDVGLDSVVLNISASENISSSFITTLLDRNVALPNYVEIRAVVGGQERIVVAEKRMTSETVRFPLTTSKDWTIKFIFSQPLRISELKLNQDNADRDSSRGVRFLAQPDHVYRIYFDPDRNVSVETGESARLSSADNVFLLSEYQSKNNPNYVFADSDNDGVRDILDNCISQANPDQEDIDSNGLGDICEDFDQDGVLNAVDNCPNDPNRRQADEDGDGLGDACDDEESRITEKYAWLPWVGIGSAALVIILLLVLTARMPKKPEDVT